jgi:hypothetical protein
VAAVRRGGRGCGLGGLAGRAGRVRLRGGQFAWFLELLFLVIMAGYVTAILVVTGRRPRVAPATLAIGTLLGLVMYAVAPLGRSKDATEPWLAGSAIDPVVALAGGYGLTVGVRLGPDHRRAVRRSLPGWRHPG